MKEEYARIASIIINSREEYVKLKVVLNIMAITAINVKMTINFKKESVIF